MFEAVEKAHFEETFTGLQLPDLTTASVTKVTQGSEVPGKERETVLIQGRKTFLPFQTIHS